MYFHIEKFPLFKNIAIVGNETAILKLVLNPTSSKHFQAFEKNTSRFTDAFQQLEDYFAGTRTQFNLQLELQGTPFQKKVLTALQKINYGQTISYSALALKIKNPNAARAIGLVMNKNQLPIFLPCHRVIGKNGHLTGFQGGLNFKQYLLNIEGHSINGY